MHRMEVEYPYPRNSPVRFEAPDRVRLHGLVVIFPVVGDPQQIVTVDRVLDRSDVSHAGEEDREVQSDRRLDHDGLEDMVGLDQSVGSHAACLGNEFHAVAQYLFGAGPVVRPRQEVGMDAQLNQIAVRPEPLDGRARVGHEPGARDPGVSQHLCDRVDRKIRRPIDIQRNDDFRHHGVDGIARFTGPQGVLRVTPKTRARYTGASSPLAKCHRAGCVEQAVSTRE